MTYRKVKSITIARNPLRILPCKSQAQLFDLAPLKFNIGHSSSGIERKLLNNTKHLLVMNIHKETLSYLVI